MLEPSGEPSGEAPSVVDQEHHAESAPTDVDTAESLSHKTTLSLSMDEIDGFAETRWL